MNLKEAMKRIEALEAEVARLKAQPAQHHYHYYPQPLVGQPCPQPLVPGLPTWPHITCGAAIHGAAQPAILAHNVVAWTDGLGNGGTFKLGEGVATYGPDH